MVLVQYRRRVRKLFGILRSLLPLQIQKPIEIVAYNVVIGRRRLHTRHTRKLFKRLFLHLFGHTLGFYALFELVLLVFVVAEFGVNGFKLFAQIKIFLTLFYVALYRGVYFLFQLGNFQFVVKVFRKQIELFAQLVRFEYALFFLNTQLQRVCRRVNKLFLILGSAQHVGNVLPQKPVGGAFQNFGNGIPRATQIRLFQSGVARGNGHSVGVRVQAVIIGVNALYFYAVQPLARNANAVAGKV